MTNLRAACVHGQYDVHNTRVIDGYGASVPGQPCPGGREVTIDYEAAADQLGLVDWVALQNKHPSSVEMPPYEWLLSEATAIVAAAIGDTK